MPTLNTQQQQILNSLIAFLISSHSFIILEGCAGSGKTTVLSKLINSLTNKTYIICAPTHKAVEIINKKSATTKAITLDNLLNGYQKINTITNKIYHCLSDISSINYDVIIIDESSMINNNHLKKLLTISNVKIIFVGDRNQLPPVGLSMSPVFNEEYQTLQLSTSMRQQQNSSILTLANKIINNQFSIKTINNFIKTNNINKNQVLLTNRTYFEQLLIKDFNSSNYNNNPDFCRCLSYTNHQSIHYSNKIKKSITGSMTPVCGEKYTTNKNIEHIDNNGNRSTLISTNRTIEIKKIIGKSKITIKNDIISGNDIDFIECDSNITHTLFLPDDISEVYK
mgnify:FL=1